MQDPIFEVIEKAISKNLFNIVKVNAINDLNFVMYKVSEKTRIENIVFKNKKEASEEIFYILYKNYKDELITKGFDPEDKQMLLMKKIRFYIMTRIKRVDQICTDLKYKSIIFEENNIKYINLFKTTEILDKKIEWEHDKFENINKIILNLCGDNKDYYNYFMDWLALTIQFPSIRVTNGIIFTGYYGTGKGELTDILKIILGNTMQIVQADMFKQKWNDFLEGKLLIIGNEIAYASNDERYYVANKLKSIISDVDIQIEGKFEPIRNSKNYARVIIFSNDKSPIVIQNGDRRYFVVSPKTTLLDNEEYNTKGIFEIEYYNKWKESENYKNEIWAFAKHLQNRVIDKTIAYKCPPITYEKKQIINISETNFKGNILKLIVNNTKLLERINIDEKDIISINFKELYKRFIIEETTKKGKYENITESQFKANLFIHCDMKCMVNNQILYIIINKNVFKQIEDLTKEMMQIIGKEE